MLTARKLLWRVLAATAVLLLVMAVCAFIGSEPVSPREVLNGLTQRDQLNPSYEIFVHVRLPRIILAALVGASLACSGVIFQALLRNPLADPYILGISSGAALGAMISIVSGFSWTIWGRSPTAVFAFVGALATVWLVWLVGKLAGRYHITGLLLAGVVVNAFFSALIMLLTAISRSRDVYATIFWLMGNIVEEQALVLWLAGGALLACLYGMFRLGPCLNVISFGDRDAHTMGIEPGKVRLAAFALAAFITAVAVSLSGLVGFVGLIVPHAVRLVFGPDHRQLIPISALSGAAFLVAADSIARTIVAPAQLPVGVVTAIIGGPFFLLMLISYSRRVSWYK